MKRFQYRSFVRNEDKTFSLEGKVPSARNPKNAKEKALLLIDVLTQCNKEKIPIQKVNKNIQTQVLNYGYNIDPAINN